MGSRQTVEWWADEPRGTYMSVYKDHKGYNHHHYLNIDLNCGIPCEKSSNLIIFTYVNSGTPMITIEKHWSEVVDYDDDQLDGCDVRVYNYYHSYIKTSDGWKYFNKRSRLNKDEEHIIDYAPNLFVKDEKGWMYKNPISDVTIDLSDYDVYKPWTAFMKKYIGNDYVGKVIYTYQNIQPVTTYYKHTSPSTIIFEPFVKYTNINSSTTESNCKTLTIRL